MNKTISQMNKNIVVAAAVTASILGVFAHGYLRERGIPRTAQPSEFYLSDANGRRLTSVFVGLPGNATWSKQNLKTTISRVVVQPGCSKPGLLERVAQKAGLDFVAHAQGGCVMGNPSDCKGCYPDSGTLITNVACTGFCGEGSTPAQTQNEPDGTTGYYFTGGVGCNGSSSCPCVLASCTCFGD